MIFSRKKEDFLMKKFTTLIMGLTAVFALTACNSKGKEVKAEDFKEKAAKIEEHSYTEATLKYSYKQEYKIPNTGPLFGDETGPLDNEEPKEGKGEAKFTLKDGEWTSDNKEALQGFGDVVGSCLKDADFELEGATADLEEQAKDYGIDAKVKYYVDPFGIELSAKGSIDTEEELTQTKTKGKLNIYEYISFDKYGFVTKLDMKMDISYTITLGVNGESYDGKMFSDIHCTVSYK